MLNNTLALTIGAESPITLTRVSEVGGSTYLLRTTEREVMLNVRQNSSSRAGVKIVSYNMLLTIRYADTVDTIGKTYTSSFTGRMEDLADPEFSAEAQIALHTLGESVMTQLAGGEV